jgi:hypothetical protein
LYAPYSYELDLLATHKDLRRKHFSLQDVVQAAGGSEPTSYQASTPERAFKCVAWITQILEKYGDGMLRGDSATFNRMEDVSERRARKYTVEVIDSPVRNAADVAWKNKDYREAKRLYESIQGNLTDVETKRYAYAAKRLVGKLTS